METLKRAFGFQTVKKFEGWYVQEAMSPCVAKAATALVDPVAPGVTWQDDADNIFVDEKYYTKLFYNDKKSIKGIEECVKVDTLIQK